MIAITDLPTEGHSWTVVDTADESGICVNYYETSGEHEIMADKYSIKGDAETIVAKLNEMGARVVGWECA